MEISGDMAGFASAVGHMGGGAGVVSDEGQRSDALSGLFRAHGARLRQALARLGGPGVDPDDLVQEVFLVAMRRAAEFTDGVPPSWLFGVATRVAASARRAARLRQFFGLEAEPEMAAHATPERLYEHAEDARRVHAVLDQLSEKKRTVFILFEMEGLTGEEIAGVVGCPLKTVWSRLQHARAEVTAGLQREQAREQEALGRRSNR